MHRSISRLAVAAASLALLSTAAAGTASAGSPGTPGAPGVGDSVYPNLGNGGYQADRYLIEMAYDPATKLIDATMSMSATATQHLSRFDLDSYGLDISSVIVNGRTAAFSQQDHELVITPRATVYRGTAFKVQVRYKAEPGIKFSALEPGTTATDMTAAFGIGRSPEQSAAFVVRLATLGPDGPTGSFQDETGELPW